MADIGAIGGIRAGAIGAAGLGAAKPATAGGDLFGRMLSDAVGTLVDLQANADAKAQALAAGENIDLHDVMIAQEQSSLAFQFGLQVRNKVVEAYQDVMRMAI
ncbi:MAG: flagellar hook-basal body complex protein FliE [Dehalococcoidia bacterium]